jgi:hypothetical protein
MSAYTSAQYSKPNCTPKRGLFWHCGFLAGEAYDRLIEEVSGALAATSPASVTILRQHLARELHHQQGARCCDRYSRRYRRGEKIGVMPLFAAVTANMELAFPGAAHSGGGDPKKIRCGAFETVASSFLDYEPSRNPPQPPIHRKVIFQRFSCSGLAFERRNLKSPRF